MFEPDLYSVQVNVDDCWMHHRDPDGKIVPDPEKFPSGMKALGDYVHKRGLKFGIYSSPGNFTCEGYVGSWGHERQDAESYAEWGVDYVKVCLRMSTAIDVKV